MSIMDLQNVLCLDQTITDSIATSLISAFTIDLGLDKASKAVDIAAGREVAVRVIITTGTGAATATITPVLKVSADAACTQSSAVVHTFSSIVMTTFSSAVSAGGGPQSQVIVLPIGKIAATESWNRFLAVTFTVSGNSDATYEAYAHVMPFGTEGYHRYPIMPGASYTSA